MASTSLKPRVDDRPRAILLVLCAYACFTGIDTCARWLAREAALPPMEVSFIRYLGHLMLVAALFGPFEGRALVRTQSLGAELWRGLFLLLSTVCNFTAVKYLPMSLTASIFFTTPLLACALSWALLGEKVGPRRWSAILVGFVGVMLAIQPWGAQLHWAIGFSLGAALFAALYGIWTRKLAGVDGTNTQQFYAALAATIGVAPLALVDWVWPVRSIDWTVFFAIGFFGWVGHQFITVAHRYAPVAVLAPFIYVQLIFLSLADFVVFGVRPDPWLAPGAAIVIGSGLYIWLRERRLSGA